MTRNDAAPPHDDAVTASAVLLPRVWEELVLDTISGVHRATADRVFGLVPLSDGPRAVHDGIAELVYGTLAATTRAARSVLALAGQLGRGLPDPAALAESAAARHTQAILNGLIGGELEAEGSPLAIRMSLRAGHRDIPLDRDVLGELHPQPLRRAAVLVHGLTESDDAWSFRRDQRGQTYDDVLLRKGYAPLRLRYNSGRHISTNGRELSEWLETLHHAWPVPLQEIVLIGHSMGGLMIRSAAEAAMADGFGWPASVSHVVMLGTPHDGAPLERLANAGAFLLAQVPELAPFAEILKRRSDGIRDLGRGYLHDDDWLGADPDAWSKPFGRRSAQVQGARHHNVGATLGASPTGPLGATIGDLLVTWDSAIARGQRWADQATVTHAGSSTHFSLLNHPEVDLLLDEILTGAPPALPEAI